MHVRIATLIGSDAQTPRLQRLANNFPTGRAQVRVRLIFQNRAIMRRAGSVICLINLTLIRRIIHGPKLLSDQTIIVNIGISLWENEELMEVC